MKKQWHAGTLRWERVKSAGGYWLLRSEEGWTVVRYSGFHGSVYSAMPGDMPRGGGEWMADATDGGINYVAAPYSESHARRHFRRLTEEASGE